ncbi:MAG: hypothetical protein FJZ95_08480 [Chloroflexi bacterium]|nr:hypothetical protein [Chloroflexota bacterium]
MGYRNIVYEKKERVGHVTLDRPDAGNSLDRAMAEELARCCRSINEDDGVWVVVITGSGKTFSEGDQRIDAELAGIASSAIASLKSPVIGAINGDALGSGLEIALACDIRLAAEGAKFGFPETSRGAIPTGGGTQRLPRIVGKGKALELILTSAVIDAQEALRIGLVNRVVPVSELHKEVQALALKLASKGPISERYAKEAINKGMDMSLGQGLRLEADLSFLLQSTKDREEGIKAFLDKRTPQFRGE